MIAWKIRERVKNIHAATWQNLSEDSLLSAMESAGAKETPDEVERKGLGTPATRAGVIEKLVRIGFVERQGNKKTKYLVPTDKGTSLITVMPEQIQSATMTAEWEQKLLKVEKQDIASEDFMAEIKDMVVDLIETYEPVKGADKLFPPRQYKQYKKYPKKGASRWQR